MTIRDVAERCGVSVSTVSRVLNEKPDVSDDVRARVLAAIDELHYIPNSSARSLVQTASANIGVIVRGGGNPFYTPIIQAIEQTINAAGYSMSIRHIPDSADEVAIGASLSKSNRLSGLILLGGCFDYSEDQVAAIDIPFLCCTFTNSFGFLHEGTCSSVSIDDRAEARNAVKHLISKGHRNIAIMLDDRNDSSIGQLRFEGYCDALKEAGIPLREELICECGEYDMEAAYQSFNTLLGSNPGITAVFTIADTLAFSVMKAVYETGLKIPEDISIISIDGIEISRFTVPTLTTLVQPVDRLGYEAAQTLINVIEGRAAHKQITLRANLREGGTVADISQNAINKRSQRH